MPLTPEHLILLLSGGAKEDLVNFLTNNNSIGTKQKVDIGSKTAYHQASCNHEATEDGHWPCAESGDAGAADGTFMGTIGVGGERKTKAQSYFE